MKRSSWTGASKYRPRHAARLLSDLTGVGWVAASDRVGAPLPDGSWIWFFRDPVHARRWHAHARSGRVASVRCEARPGEHLEEVVALQVGAAYETLVAVARGAADGSEACDT